jgi:hypothetical protein
VERSYDVVMGTDYAILLVITYPIALITPLAGFGQLAMLIWVLGYAEENGASIGPMYGYMLAWVSAACMIAGVVWPVEYPRRGTQPALADRALTLTWRRARGHWMPHQDAFAVLYFVLAVGVGAVCWLTNAPTGAYAVLLIGFIFVWLLHGRVCKAEFGPGKLESQREQKLDEPSNNRVDNSSAKVDRGGANWVLFLTLAYAASVIGVETLSQAFGAGFSGEEKTAALVRGVGILAVLVPLGVILWRHAVPPRFPRNIVLGSVCAFSLFIMMAAISMTHLHIIQSRTLGYLILAGVMLTSPLWFHLYGNSRMGEKRMADPEV